MTERVLCVAGHPDDETLGCGATLAKHVAAGDAVSVSIMADGASSRTATIHDIAARAKSAREALAILGAAYTMHAFQDNEMDTVSLLTIAKAIERDIGEFQPTIVYTHHAGDLNVDHRITHQAVNVACRPQPGGTVKRLLYFEVACSTAWGAGFSPDWYEDVAGFMDVKMRALECYAGEMREPPHPRSRQGVINLASMRGSAVGVAAAEAFMVGRVVQ